MPKIESARNEVSQAQKLYGIPSHIYMCITDDGTVILDLKRDTYLGLGCEETELLADAVPEWPKPNWHRGTCRDPHKALQATNELCESLAADGVLEQISVAEKVRPAAILRDMRGEWVSMGDELELPGRVTLRDIANFISAYCWARFSLAWRPLSIVVEKIKMRKVRGAGGIKGFDHRRVAEMVDTFRRMRPFVFAAEGRCLLHALTLVRFLGQYQFHPEWVIGVTTQPWSAHSWVQWDNFLLDSNPEKVCGYTPIMAV